MPIGIIPVLRRSAGAHRRLLVTRISMPIGIIPVLRHGLTITGATPHPVISMPIGIIPVLRRIGSYEGVMGATNFNAYRHYPCVATPRWHLSRVPFASDFNAYRHYPCVATGACS